MHDDTRRALDGEIVDQDLSVREAAELAAIRSMIARVQRALPDEPLPDLAPGVLRRIRELESAAPAALPATDPAARRKGLLEWLVTPRLISVRLRPAHALAPVALLAAVLTIMLGDGRAGDIPAPPVAAAAATEAPVLIEFRFAAPQATRVELAGSFTEWQPGHAMTRSEPGIWTVVVPLSPGVHDYAFVVDGERWVPDPDAPAVGDGFGGFNSRLAVLAPDAPALSSAGTATRRPL
ncbi:MAG: glycogen-binding domain-containing protein [Gemmatimonadota bacterium]